MVRNLEVEWVGEELRARWQDGEDPTVFVSASPDDAGTVIVPVQTPGRIRVAGLPAGFRAYVHVLDLDGEWSIAAERLIRLGAGAHAVDLGGHPVAAGDDRSAGHIRWGRLYAGDPLDQLDATGRERLDGLHIHTVCDLRPADETPGRPSWLAAEVAWELPGLGEGDDAQVAEVASLVSDPTRHAVLVHAGVGQDRAVVVTTLLLSALGVADADLPFFPTRGEVLADLRTRFGSIEAYLAAAGPTPVDLEALRSALVS